jgi:hypothetical protein
MITGCDHFKILYSTGIFIFLFAGETIVVSAMRYYYVLFILAIHYPAEGKVKERYHFVFGNLHVSVERSFISLQCFMWCE